MYLQWCENRRFAVLQQVRLLLARPPGETLAEPAVHVVMDDFFSDDEDDTAPVPVPVPTSAPVPTAPVLREEPVSLPNLPRVFSADQLTQSTNLRRTQPPTPMAAPPTPPLAVTTEACAERKPFGDDEAVGQAGQCSSGAGSSDGAPRSYESILANYQTRTSHGSLEDVQKGRKAPMRSAAKAAPSGSGMERTADKQRGPPGKRPRLGVEDLEEEALAFSSGDEGDGNEEEVPPLPATRSPTHPSPRAAAAAGCTGARLFQRGVTRDTAGRGGCGDRRGGR